MKTKSLLFSFLLLAGCGTPNDATFDNQKRAPTTGVEVYREGQKPERPYKEIGELSQEYFVGEDAVVTRKFIESAKRHGANAIIMLPGREAAYRFDMFGRSGNRYVWRAIMVSWIKS
jgi:hypothetical protein